MPTHLLFGPGDWECPWFQYDAGIVKEVSQDALDFIQQTVGLHGPYHDQHGYMVDMKTWDALVKYIAWCDEQSIDFLFHVDQLSKGDTYYRVAATAKMEAFMKASEAALK
jgi:hypothetical protein